jgi:3-dehydroquinate dehydratase-1
LGLRWVKNAPKSAFGSLDMLEARLDELGNAALPSRWPLPVIATARHPKEGGAGNLGVSERRRLLTDALEWATAVDVELRSAREMDGVIAAAHARGRVVILSHHDFKATPSLAKLKELAARAADEGADLFKVAAVLKSPDDLLRLAGFQSSKLRIPVVAMGMGRAGRFSRLMLGGLGSPLCYGWLGKPQVPGQWPALGMRAILDEVFPA